MTCGRYWELLSARLDRELTKEEAESVELHCAGCPACRIMEAQLTELQRAFADLEDVPAPEGFAQGVMDRVQAETAKKTAAPLFRRPRFRALAGLAACVVLAVGLYGAARQQNADTPMSFSKDAADIGSASCAPPPMARSIPEAPITAACSAPDSDGAVPVPYDNAPAAGGYEGAEIVLILDRLPEGADDLLLPDAEPDGEGRACLSVTLEQLEQVERMVQEQGLNAARAQGTAEAGRYVILFPYSADEAISG